MSISTPRLKPVRRRSVSDTVFEQLRDAIVTGEIGPGEQLPSERALSQMLEVNRGAVREALKRLEQVRLIAIHHGGATRALDFRESATLELAAQLLVTPHGELDLQVARSMVELRAAIAPDIARLAALRGSPELPERLRRILENMAAESDLVRRDDLGQDFWNELVANTANLAYQLIFNTIREVRERYKQLVQSLVADRSSDVDSLARIADAIAARDPEAARRAAERHAAPIAQRLSAEIESLAKSATAPRSETAG